MAASSSDPLQTAIFLEVEQAISVFTKLPSPLQELPSTILEKQEWMDRSHTLNSGALFVHKLLQMFEKQCPTTAIECGALLRCILAHFQEPEKKLHPVLARDLLESTCGTLSALLAQNTFSPTRHYFQGALSRHLLVRRRLLPPFWVKTLEHLPPNDPIAARPGQSVASSIKRGLYLPLAPIGPSFLREQNRLISLVRPYCYYSDEAELDLEKILWLRKKLPSNAPLLMIAKGASQELRATAHFQQIQGGILHLLAPKSALEAEEKRALCDLLSPQEEKGSFAGFVKEVLLLPQNAAFFPEKEISGLSRITLLAEPGKDFQKAAQLIDETSTFRRKKIARRGSFSLPWSLFLAGHSSEEFPEKLFWQEIASSLLSYLGNSGFLALQNCPKKACLQKDVERQAVASGAFVPACLVEKACSAALRSASTILLFGERIP
ncbi:MAG: hypothetical protein AAGF04_02795 [Chlamydiota bacterium]